VLHKRHIVAAVGLRSEANLAADRVVTAIAGGGDSRRLASSLDSALRTGAVGIISFGIAGGVAPHLPPGAVIVAAGVIAPDGSRIITNDAWRRSLTNRLRQAFELDLIGSDHAIAEAHAKTALHLSTGAAAVDMESHVAAAVAARHNVPFAAIRVVADSAELTLPPAALLGMRPDGRFNVKAVLQSLAGKPSQLPRLIRTAWDATSALKSLNAVRSVLGPGFGLLDIGDLALDVPQTGEIRTPLPSALLGSLGAQAA
jgi:adenosylhomocysteine nucleosidase